jgi:hypothetical protein
VSCEPAVLNRVFFFALLDNDARAVLAAHVELRTFASHQRIYKVGDSAGTRNGDAIPTFRLTIVSLHALISSLPWLRHRGQQRASLHSDSRIDGLLA